MWWWLAVATAADRADCRVARQGGGAEAWVWYAGRNPTGQCIGEAFAALTAVGVDGSRVAAAFSALASAIPSVREEGGRQLRALLAAPPPVAAAVPRPAPPPPEELAGPPPDVTVEASGLAWRTLVAGTGTERPRADARVTVHYALYAAAPPGADPCLDESWSRGRPPVFPVDAVVQGFAEGVQGMVVGETRRLWVPPALGYGEHPRPGIPAGWLVFDVVLLDFVADP